MLLACLLKKLGRKNLQKKACRLAFHMISLGISLFIATAVNQTWFILSAAQETLFGGSLLVFLVNYFGLLLWIPERFQLKITLLGFLAGLLCVVAGFGSLALGFAGLVSFLFQWMVSRKWLFTPSCQAMIVLLCLVLIRPHLPFWYYGVMLAIVFSSLFFLKNLPTLPDKNPQTDYQSMLDQLLLYKPSLPKELSLSIDAIDKQGRMCLLHSQQYPEKEESIRQLLAQYLPPVQNMVTMLVRVPTHKRQKVLTGQAYSALKHLSREFTIQSRLLSADDPELSGRRKPVNQTTGISTNNTRQSECYQLMIGEIRMDIAQLPADLTQPIDNIIEQTQLILGQMQEMSLTFVENKRFLDRYLDMTLNIVRKLSDEKLRAQPDVFDKACDLARLRLPRLEQAFRQHRERLLHSNLDDIMVELGTLDKLLDSEGY